LPVSFYVFSDGVYVSETAAAYVHLLGAKVTAIGGLGIDEVRERIATLNYNASLFI
jgi:hypothetical protein